MDPLWILVPCSDVIEEIQNKLQDIRNPMTAMMVLLREMDLETDSELGGEGAITAGEKPEVTLNERLVLEYLIESRDHTPSYGL